MTTISESISASIASSICAAPTPLGAEASFFFVLLYQLEQPLSITYVEMKDNLEIFMLDESTAQVEGKTVFRQVLELDCKSNEPLL